MNKAVFLDRDGVINKKRDDYVKNIKEFVLLNHVPEAIKLLNEQRFLVIVITNQSAVNRGLLTHHSLTEIHDFMKNELKKNDAFIDGIYYCPHRPDEHCRCRKPETKLIEQAVMEHSIAVDLSYFIGDNETDMLAAKKVGLSTIKMEENSSLLEAVKFLITDTNESI